MTKWFFTADLHLDHPHTETTGIITHCNRPFKSVLEMNIALMENWNMRVNRRDIVVILGDFAWATNRKYVQTMFINRLHGQKIFVKGNHDFWLNEKRHMYNKKINGIKIYGSHYPLRSWPSGFNFHGHSHGNLKPLYNQLDVGVDCHNFTPISFEEAYEIIINRRENEYDSIEDHHLQILD
jgi:calcineurin-like phosphoesterase family protein